MALRAAAAQWLPRRLHAPSAAASGRPVGDASALKPRDVRPCVAKVDVHHGRCISCAGCVGVCPVDTIVLRGEHLVVDQAPCISCGLCIQFCPVGALSEGSDYGAEPAPRPVRVHLV